MLTPESKSRSNNDCENQHRRSQFPIGCSLVHAAPGHLPPQLHRDTFRSGTLYKSGGQIDGEFRPSVLSAIGKESVAADFCEIVHSTLAIDAGFHVLLQRFLLDAIQLAGRVQGAHDLELPMATHS
jgi:hypothetical protein